MLGIAGMRSFDKLKKTDTKRIGNPASFNETELYIILNDIFVSPVKRAGYVC